MQKLDAKKETEHNLEETRTAEGIKEAGESRAIMEPT